LVERPGSGATRRRYLVPLGTFRGHDTAAWQLGADLKFALVEVATRRAGGSASRRVVPVDQLDRRELDDLIDAFARSPGPRRFARLPDLMGVINVTPDSFSDGGRFLDPAAAIAQALALADAGAAILDVGGESTRPGATPVPPEIEIGRVLPVVAALAARGLVVSIDTRHAATMRAALAAGARIVNDVSALTHDPQSLEVVAEAGCDVVLMHAQGDPRTMQLDPRYDDAPLDVYDFLEARVRACFDAGIARERIMVDPGIGFGKTLEHNLQILRALAMYRGLGCRVLLGASRKSFIAKAVGAPGLAPDARLPGSIAAALAGFRAGIDVIRCHDVAETLQALRVADAIEAAWS
jgi:dihydropteroate synthase